MKRSVKTTLVMIEFCMVDQTACIVCCCCNQEKGERERERERGRERGGGGGRGKRKERKRETVCVGVWNNACCSKNKFSCMA